MTARTLDLDAILRIADRVARDRRALQGRSTRMSVAEYILASRHLRRETTRLWRSLGGLELHECAAVAEYLQAALDEHDSRLTERFVETAAESLENAAVNLRLAAAEMQECAA